MIDKDCVIQKVIHFFSTSPHFKKVLPEGFCSTTPLMKSSIIDSLSIMYLIKFIETEFSIEVDASDLAENNFDSLERLSHFVLNKVGQTI